MKETEYELMKKRFLVHGTDQYFFIKEKSLDELCKQYHKEKIKEHIHFKTWIEQVIEIDNRYDFLLSGTQTGEIFDWWEYYSDGLTPDEAIRKDYKEFG